MVSGGATGDRAVVWVYRTLLAAFLAVLAAQVVLRGTGDWETVYLAAAHNLRDGRDLLDYGTNYTYPPFGALFAVPFAFLPRPASLAAWAVLNTLAAVALLAGAWRLSGGRGLPGRAGTGPVDHAAFWLGGAAAAGFLLDAACNWQTDLIIGAVLVGGCLLLARGRSLSAGVAFGAAAAFKCTPLLFAPFLLWKRRFAAAAAVPVVALGLNLLPDVVYPPADGTPRVVAWGELFLKPMANADYDPGAWTSAVGFNHSLAGVNLRWLAYERTGPGGSSVLRTDRPPATELKRLNLALAAGLGLVALVALRRPVGAARPALATELGVVCTLMLLLSPMSSKPHFVVLLLPQLALVRAGWATRDRLLLGLAGLAAIAGLCTGKDVVGRPTYEFLMWNGLVFFLTLGLFLGCCRALRAG